MSGKIPKKMAINLYEHQKRFLAANPDRRLLCWDTGTGKTLTAILWANLGKSEALFIVPKSLRENWQRNVQMHFDYKYKIVTKEEFRRDHKTLERYPQVVADEAHYFSGEKSQMSKALIWYVKEHEIERVLLPTATPYLSSPWNIFTLAKILRHQWSWIKFRDHFFEDRYVGRREIAGKTVGRLIKVVKPNMEKDIARCVAQIGDVVRIDECADIPEQVFETEFFELNKSQKQAIAAVVEMNPMVRYTKYHQIEGGTLKSDGYSENQYFEPPQMERLYELAKENKKMAVVCRYNFEIDMIRTRFQVDSMHQWKVFVIRGDVANRDEIVQEVEASDEAIVLINAACSEGFEIPSVPLMVFWSLSFSYKDYKQMLGRILRLNKLKKNLYIFFLTTGVSMGVYGAIMNKRDFDVEIYHDENRLQGEGLSDVV